MKNEKAIKILDNMPIPSHYFILDKEPITFEEMAEAIEMAIEALKDERAKGEWIMNKTSARGRNYTCTICKKVSRNKFNFCPNCGAKMKEADNER